LEEHTVIGGLGEAVCSLVSEKHPVKVHRLGIQDRFGHSGSAKELLDEFGLTAPHIADAVRKMK
jgi:transketolase